MSRTGFPATQKIEGLRQGNRAASGLTLPHFLEFYSPSTLAPRLSLLVPVLPLLGDFVGNGYSELSDHNARARFFK
jgi:hypothetical protein